MVAPSATGLEPRCCTSDHEGGGSPACPTAMLSGELRHWPSKAMAIRRRRRWCAPRDFGILTFTKKSLTHALVVGQALLGLRELVAVSLLGQVVILLVRSHGVDEL